MLYGIYVTYIILYYIKFIYLFISIHFLNGNGASVQVLFSEIVYTPKRLQDCDVIGFDLFHWL